MFVSEKSSRPEKLPASSATAAQVGPDAAPSELQAVQKASASPGSCPPRRRVLFMDDDARRLEVFLDRCPEAVWVRSAEACIARLANSWDEVHLDHDLGGEQYVDPNREDCGMAVVRWLCETPRPQHRDARFFIHSCNLAAASLMVECLLRNGYTAESRPFGFDLVDLLTFEEFSPRQIAQAARARRARIWRIRLRTLTRFLRRWGRGLP